MWIENLTEKTYVMYIAISREPDLKKELDTINEIVQARGDCYVIINLANIEMLTSSSITSILKLHNTLTKNGRMLILCKVSLPTKGVFRTAELNSVFNFALDMFAAQTMIQQHCRRETQKTAT